MRTTRNTPQWAVELTTQVCKDYKRALPEVLQWYIKGPRYWQDVRVYSSGRTWRKQKAWGRKYPSKIHISAGIDEADQELVLLHELAHHLLNRTSKGRRESHSNRFWKLAFELYDRYGVDLDFAWKRERDYKVKAAVGYQAVLAKK